jgi:hypothetical protein
MYGGDQLGNVCVVWPTEKDQSANWHVVDECLGEDQLTLADGCASRRAAQSPAQVCQKRLQPLSNQRQSQPFPHGARPVQVHVRLLDRLDADTGLQADITGRRSYK